MEYCLCPLFISMTCAHTEILSATGDEQRKAMLRMLDGPRDLDKLGRIAGRNICLLPEGIKAYPLNTLGLESIMSNRLHTAPNDLRAFWMPFTANRQFKKEPRLFVSAKDMHYTTHDGRQVLDATAGLWCVKCRSLPSEDHGSDSRAGRRAGLCARLPARPPQGL